MRTLNERMAGKPVHRLGIDVFTNHLNRLRKRLDTSARVLNTYDAGAYLEDRAYSQLWVDTYWTEDELYDWLYRTKHGCAYVGTWERREDQAIP